MTLRTATISTQQDNEVFVNRKRIMKYSNIELSLSIPPRPVPEYIPPNDPRPERIPPEQEPPQDNPLNLTRLEYILH